MLAKIDKERKRFYEVARGSIIELDTGFEISVALNYCTKEEVAIVGDYIIRCFQMMCRMLDVSE
jgi:four helix bundle protein